MHTSEMVRLAIGASLFSICCGNSNDDCRVTRTCPGTTSHAGSAGKASGGSGNDGGSDGAGTSNNGGGGSSNAGSGGDAGGSSGCKGDVSDDAACWTTNEYGVFVSSEHGDDAVGSGTKEAPYATIGKGIANAGGKKVYVCLGAMKDTYEEQLLLDDSASGLQLYGGFDCESWEYSKSRKAAVKSPKNIGLRIKSAKGVTLENLRITAADGSGTDVSSYGAFITDSKSVVLRRVEVTAGAGLKGADGMAGAVGPDGATAGDEQKGTNASCVDTKAAPGGAWTGAVCGSRGGDGGGAILTGSAPGAAGSPQKNVSPEDFKNGGLAGADDGKAAGAGQDGSPGKAGALANPAPVEGAFDASGYSLASGKSGTVGYPGQGGGGGGSSFGSETCRGASGGAGGMGGCGGEPGTGGIGGGASVGLLSFASDVTLDSCTVTSGIGGIGGIGGPGGFGGSGKVGGPGGDAVMTIARGGTGGAGGNGGPGGSGSGGSGGPSYALVFGGSKPRYGDDTKLTPGKGGKGGEGGQVIKNGPKAPNGADGAAATELEVTK